MTEQITWLETTQPQSSQHPSFRLMRDGKWIGTVWAHVCGFCWARIGVPGVGYIGDGCASIDDGKNKLLAYLASEAIAA